MATVRYRVVDPSGRVVMTGAGHDVNLALLRGEAAKVRGTLEVSVNDAAFWARETWEDDGSEE